MFPYKEENKNEDFLTQFHNACITSKQIIDILKSIEVRVCKKGSRQNGKLS